MSEVDYVKSVTEAALTVGIDTATDLLKDVGSAAKHKLVNASAKRLKTYSEYLKKTALRLRRAKTLFFREEPRDLYSFYVPIDLERGDSTVPIPDYSTIAAMAQHIIITGTGGSGKSTLLRHLFLSCIGTRSSIPVFIELRRLNNLTHADLLNEIGVILGDSGTARSPRFVQTALNCGKLVLFLDGFDELGEKLQTQIAGQINTIASDFPRTKIIATSRPLEDFVNWSSFVEMNTARLTLHKAKTLVNRLGIDHDLERRFVESLESGLFQKHEQFLSNPLLLLIMLLTYHDFAEIPSKLHLFFEQAFFALLHRHDATKGGLEGALHRSLRCKLDPTEFHFACAAFGIVTYLRRQYRFSPRELQDAVTQASELTGLSIDIEHFRYDLTTGVCLLVQEGHQYAFSHRLFQEYFTAAFLTKTDIPERTKLIWRACDTEERDPNVLRMLFGMNQQLAESSIIVPVLRLLRKNAGNRKTLSRSAHIRLLSLLVGSVGLHSDANLKSSKRQRRSWWTVMMLASDPETRFRYTVFRFITSHYNLDRSPITPVPETRAKQFHSAIGAEYPFTEPDAPKKGGRPQDFTWITLKALSRNLKAFDAIQDYIWLSRRQFSEALSLLTELEEGLEDSRSSAMSLLHVRD